ncbi:MAG: MerR family transcriptional regulator, partial [Clostridia bacterium]
DENNGYRYYTSDQFETFDSIFMLREIGVPIKEIKTFLNDRDNVKTIKLLNNQKERLNEQVKNLQKNITKLEHKINIIEDINISDEEVIFKHLDTEYLAVQIVKNPYQLLDVDIAFKKLLHIVSENKYPYHHQLGVMISSDNLFNKKYTSAEFVFVPLYSKLKSKNIIEKKSGLYAITYHKGAYLKVGDTYDLLLNEINRNNYKVIGNSYEYCILDNLTSATSKDYVTKIEIPIKFV